MLKKKTLGNGNKGTHFILKYLCLIGFNKCVHACTVCVCVCLKGTYALHGFPGSGRSSAECETLWTRLTWRYLAPGMQITVVSQTENIDNNTYLADTPRV